MNNRLGNAWWIVILTQLILAAVVLIVFFPLDNETFARSVADPVWLGRNSRNGRQLLRFLTATLQLGVAAAAFIPVIACGAWFAFMRFKSVELPGEARRSLAAWLIIAAAATALVSTESWWLLHYSILQRLVDPELGDLVTRITPPVRAFIGGGMLLYFWIAYFVGTFIATPMLFWPAVPLASRLRAV